MGLKKAGSKLEAIGWKVMQKRSKCQPLELGRKCIKKQGFGKMEHCASN